MRLLFKKGMQKELLKQEKRDLTWNQFAEKLGLKFGKLKSFSSEESLIDDITFNKLSLKTNYKRFIVKRFDNNWGRSKGGKNSKGNLKNIKIPNKGKDLAEFWGIVLGDGHVQKIKKYKIGVYNIKIAGHSIDDRDYLLDFVKPLCEKLFEVKSRTYEPKNKKGLYIIIEGRKIIDFFENNEFKSGNKIINQTTIPKWIKKNDRFLASCLRGLYDTDGSFYRLGKQNSYQIHFKNHNKKLLNDVRKSLLKLGINTSKIMKNRSIVITKKSEIEKFYKLVGFHNPKHLNKIKVWAT
jgi:intein/homing endonuclease